MQALCYFTCLVLCSHALLSSGASFKCNSTQYSWPTGSPTLCCNKCPPGHRMSRRDDYSCSITCEPCQDDQYRDTYNVEMSCRFCKTCNTENMVQKSNCSATHDTVCTCKAGYRCKDADCTACELIPTTTKKPTLPPPTTALKPTALTTAREPSKPDTMWFLVIIALLCAGIALVVVTKVKPLLRWIRSIYGYFLAEKQEHTDDTDIEDNDMPTPVQEVCGKCDQPIEV